MVPRDRSTVPLDSLLSSDLRPVHPVPSYYVRCQYLKAMLVFSIYYLPLLFHALVPEQKFNATVSLVSGHPNFRFFRSQRSFVVCKNTTYVAHDRVHLNRLLKLYFCVIGMEMDIARKHSINMDCGPPLHLIFWI